VGVLETAQVVDQLWRRDVDRRLDEHFERLEEHEARLAVGDARMSELTGKIDTNTDLTGEVKVLAEGVKKDTAALVSAFKAWGGFTTVTKWLLAFIVGAAALIIAGGVIYWFIVTGTLPHK
jgi:hypothetical protein